MSAKYMKPLVAIACGGTGGHLFPGISIAEELMIRGCDTILLVSSKEIDQQAVKSCRNVQVVTLPAVGLTRRKLVKFATGFLKSFMAARDVFHEHPPQAVLAMGGFTSAPPVLAGKMCGASTFLHESNTIPGKANRWLACTVDQAFVGFPSAGGRLRRARVLTTGTPVRPQFQTADPRSCRMALGLDPENPILLVVGGSQGASPLNDLVVRSLPELKARIPRLQLIHLTGQNDLEKSQTAYAAQGIRAVVRPFLTEMELALGAATIVLSRAGASSLAELAAMRAPSILIPYPTAADNHQLYNARAFSEAGAALLLEQRHASPDKLVSMIADLLEKPERLQAMRDELVRWHAPKAAESIAERILAVLKARGAYPRASQASPASGRDFSEAKSAVA